MKARKKAIKNRLFLKQWLLYSLSGFIIAIIFILVIRYLHTIKEENTLAPAQYTNTEVSIVLPTDIAKYKQAMTDYTQIGGENPLKTTSFEARSLKVDIAPDEDIKRLSAQIAAQQFKLGGGPEKVIVEYFNVVDDTAYIMLNIDTDGRAGVSVAQAIIHPVVEKTLLQYPEIKNVVFGYANALPR